MFSEQTVFIHFPFHVDRINSIYVFLLHKGAPMKKVIFSLLAVFVIIAADITTSAIALNNEVKSSIKAYETQIEKTKAVTEFLFDNGGYNYDLLVFKLQKEGIGIEEAMRVNNVIVVE